MRDHTTTTATVQAPGPGTWELDATHFPRPVSPIIGRNITSAFSLGMAEATARYGLPLDRLAYAQVDGWIYTQVRAVGAPPGMATPARPVFFLLSRLHPALRRRGRTARIVFEERRWRADLERWHREVKPQRVRAHLSLLAEPVATLSDDELLAHVDRCIATHAESIRLHGYFSIPAILPIGDLIAHVTEWTGLAAHQVLSAITACSPISAGREPAREALIAALRSDPVAHAILESSRDPAAILEALLGLPGEVGARTRTYVDIAGYRTLSSYDVLDCYALEAPFVLVEGLRILVERGFADLGPRAQASQAAVRDAVPADRRAEFDGLFAEACIASALRDERVLFNDCWSAGVARRALLEVGRRVVARHLLERPEHATCCVAGELRSMLLENEMPTPSPGERWRRYRSATAASIPGVLGPPPSAPPPVEWLPPSLRRGQRATLASLAAVFGDADEQPGGATVKGFGVSPGTFQGIARVITGPDDFHRIRPGDVVIAQNTSPTYNVVLPMLGALVTDRGGALSHAAIVSREYGIPGVVGCRNATALIPDGVAVRVDGDAGECRVVS